MNDRLVVKNIVLKVVSILFFVIAFFLGYRLIIAFSQSQSLIRYMLVPIGFIGMCLCIGIIFLYMGSSENKIRWWILIPVYFFTVVILLGLFGSFIF